MQVLVAFVVALVLHLAPAQQEAPDIKRLSATEYKTDHAKNKKAVLLDVRTPEEYNMGHLKGSQNVNFLGGEIEPAMQNWDKEKTYYIYCASGNRSGKTAKLMQEAGFTNVYNIGAYAELQKAGLPVKQEKKAEQ